MVDNVVKWLEELGLGQYTDVFIDNDIEWNHLPDLDHKILQDIGVKSAGHRMTILKSVAAIELETSEETTTTATKSTVTSEPTLVAEAERRQLTVMFCDLVDSTALSERLDLERYRELLGAYQDAARKAIDPYEGYIARYMGDGLLVYFGYPTAHEDDAERAVRAGLDVLNAVSTIAKSDGIPLQVRVGIATGRVLAGDIVGEGASEERSVLGETPNLAARLQGLATPNSVVIAEATKHLVEGRFDLESLKPQMVKGISEPVRAFQARAIREATRFEAATAGGLSSFVCRQSEFQLLQERWAQAKGGEGQVVVLSGEAGIGKSRMLRELREHLIQEAHTELRYQCSPYGTKTAFFPVIEQLQRSAGFMEEDSTSQKVDKLKSLIAQTLVDISIATPLLAALLSRRDER